MLVAALASTARADGDPGSDVLVFQNLFAGSDAGLSVQQQVRLGGLLKAAAGAGFPVRVAIIASPVDLGAVSELWREPRSYARFLGYELSLAYKQRLLVVMPNGFGFNWPGHSPLSGYGVLAGISIGSGADRVVRCDRGGRREAGSRGRREATSRRGYERELEHADESARPNAAARCAAAEHR